MTAKRMEVMQWWHTKTTIQQQRQSVRDILGFPGRSPRSVTGREVEMIYNRLTKMKGKLVKS